MPSSFKDNIYDTRFIMEAYKIALSDYVRWAEIAFQWLRTSLRTFTGDKRQASKKYIYVRKRKRHGPGIWIRTETLRWTYKILGKGEGEIDKFGKRHADDKLQWDNAMWCTCIPIY